MAQKVGVYRNGKDLAQAIEAIRELQERLSKVRVRDHSRSFNTELVASLELRNMLSLAEVIAVCAQERRETRGAHFREDFPRRDDSQWLKRTLATWKGETDSLPTLAYEPLDVKVMELPPGWRGYGAKDYIDHPDTPARAAEVAALRERLGGNAPRFAVQQALMPYDALLPAGLRGRNERIDEPFE